MEKSTEVPWHKAVRELAPVHFADYGYQGASVENNGIEVVVDTKHCRVHFYEDKGGLGSYVKPRVGGRYVIQYIDEVPMPVGLRLVSAAVEKQMKAVIERFRSALEGDLTDWPIT